MNVARDQTQCSNVISDKLLPIDNFMKLSPHPIIKRKSIAPQYSILLALPLKFA